MDLFYAVYESKHKNIKKERHNQMKFFGVSSHKVYTGYVCLLGVFSDANKANQYVNHIGLYNANTIARIDITDDYDKEREQELLSKYELVDISTIKKINTLIYKKWSESSAGKAFKEQ